MAPIGTWLLANVFPALLPPVDPDEREFFEIMGVPKDATNEQIRKAYKVKSLKLHPDKVAQRRGNKEEAAKEYELVQEAYAVLVNDQKRQTYRALKDSPTRYRFLSQGAMANPGALYENLTNATVGEKTRLVLLCTAIVLTLMMQPILIAAKINHLLEQDGGLADANWTVILIPFWIMGILWVVGWAGLLLVAPPGTHIPVIVNFFHYLCIYVGVWFLALKWDGNWTSSYGKVLIPIYIALVLRWISSALLLIQIQRDVARMVTVDWLEQEILDGKSLEDLSAEEGMEIRAKYLIVTVPPNFEPELPPLDPEQVDAEGGVSTAPALNAKDIEAQKVEASEEYEAANDVYYSTLGALVASLVFGLVFVIILTLKMDDQIDASYWVVFLPIWLHYGSRLIYQCFQCACATIVGDEILVEMPMEDENGADKEKKAQDTPALDNGSEIDDKEGKRPSDPDFVSAKASYGRFNAAPEDKTSDDATDDKAAPKKKLESDEEQGTTSNVDTAETKKEEAKDENGEDAGEEDGDDGVHIDEETFKAWQSAHEEAAKSAMEQQAKASSAVCNLIIQLGIIIMVVAKIDKNYDNDDPEDVGFNTFWILTPFFAFFGVILCCCACLIYGAAPGRASDLNGGTPPDNANGNAAGGDVETPSPEPIVVVAPPAPSTDVAEEGQAENGDSSPEEPAAPAPEETEDDPDMEDLD